jgi:hypothetical protein
MAVYGTYDGYGTEGITEREMENNPMLEDTGLIWPDQNGVMHPVLANDLFRAVHDAFGHGLEGAGFRARGEENAWQAHVRLFTGPAIGAITSETRGQNSWLNYGPYGEKNRNAKLEDTVFAEQKTGLMPEWTWTEGRAGDEEGTRFSQRKVSSTTPDVVAKNPVFFENVKLLANKSSFNNKLQFKEEIQRQFELGLKALKKEYGSELNPSEYNELTKKYLVDVLTQEALNAVADHPEAIGWYDQKTKDALAVVSLIHPEIETDYAAKGAFILGLAITSNGNKVDKNFEYAENAYRYFKENGRFDDKAQYGAQQVGIRDNFNQINSILDLGVSMSDLTDFMQEKILAQRLKYRNPKNGKLESIVSGELKSEMLYGAAIIGAKIGNGFYMNLWGKFDQLTMDRWFMRTWGRLTGTLIKRTPENIENGKARLRSAISAVKSNKDASAALKKFLGGNSLSKDIEGSAEQIQSRSTNKELRSILENNKLLDELRMASNNYVKQITGEKEAPANGEERAYIRNVFNAVQDKLKKDHGVDINMADLQAVIWYPEKILYESFKEGESFEEASESYGEEGAPDYFNAAKKIAESFGITKQQINEKVNESRQARGYDNGISDTEVGSGESQVSRPADKTNRLRETIKRVREAQGGERELISNKGKKNESSVDYFSKQKGTLLSGTPYAPHMTSDNAGNYVFFHVTGADFKDIKGGIDSRKFYSTRISREEKALQYGVASYYTKPTDSERMVLGDTYYVQVPASKVYPMNTDPNGYEGVANESLPNNEPFRYEKIRQEMARLAKNDGYQMAVGYWGLNESTGSVSRGMNALRGDALVPLKPKPFTGNEEFSVGEEARFSQQKALVDYDFTANGGNKAVDENGNPIIFYHGTSKESAAKIRESGFDAAKGRFGELTGISLTKNEGGAYSFKGDVIKAIISLKNPMNFEINFQIRNKIAKKITGKTIEKFSNSDWRTYGSEISQEFYKEAKRLGYDGVYQKSQSEALVFDPSSIKVIDQQSQQESPEVRFSQSVRRNSPELQESLLKPVGYQETIDAVGLTEAEIADWKERNKRDQRKQRNDVVIESLNKYRRGEITQREHINTVRSQMPIGMITNPKRPASFTDIVLALMGNKAGSGIIGMNKFIPDNSSVSVRLDIPAYDRFDIWVPTVHEFNTDKVIGYVPAAKISNVVFGAKPKKAINVATGTSKSPFATMDGYWVNSTPEELYQQALDAMNNPDWIQVGMNPERHSWFYDRSTGMPVTSAEEVIQVGSLVLAKKPTYGNINDPMFDTGETTPAGEKVYFSQRKRGITETSKRIAGVGDVNAAVNKKLTEMYNTDPNNPIFSKSVQSIKDALKSWDGVSASDMYDMLNQYGGDKILNYIKDNRGDKNMSALLLIEVFKKASATGDNDLALAAYNELNMIGSTSGQLLNQMRQLQPALMDPNAPRAVRTAVNRRIVSKVIMAEIANSGTVITSEQKNEIDNLIEQYVTSIVNEHDANKKYLKTKNNSNSTSKDVSDARKLRNDADRRVNESYADIIGWASSNIVNDSGKALSNLLQGLLLTYKSHFANAVSNIIGTIEVIPQLAGPAVRSVARAVGINAKGAGIGQAMMASYFSGRAFVQTIIPAIREAFSRGGMRPRSVEKFETGRQIMPYTAMRQLYREAANSKAIGMMYKLFTGKDLDKYNTDLLPKALSKKKDGSIDEYTPVDVIMSKMLEGSVGWIALNNFRGLYIFDRISGNAARTFAAAKLMTEYNGGKTVFNMDDVKDFMFNMTPEQSDLVDRYAKIFLYSDNESLFAKQGQRVASYLSSVADDLEERFGMENKEVQKAGSLLRFIGTTLIPYATVPSNMAAHMLELAVPIIPAIGSVYYYKKGDNNVGDMLVGRALLGSALYAMAATLVAFVTAGDDEDKGPEFKLKQELGGAKSFNKSKFLRWAFGGEDIDEPFQEDDEIISLQRYGTFGAFLDYVASLREDLIDRGLWDESFFGSLSEAPLDVISTASGSATRATLDMSVFHQQSMMFNAIKDAGNEQKNPMSKFITGQIETASNLVWPNQVSQLTQAYDAYTGRQPYVLRADDPNFSTMLKERLAKRNFPFVEAPSTLYPVLSIWGRPIEITAEQSLDPNNPRLVRDNAVVEISRLMKSLNARSPVNLTAKSIQIEDVSYPLTDTDIYTLEWIAGNIREGLIKELIFNNPDYKFAEDREKYEAIQTLSNKANKNAMDMYKLYVNESIDMGSLTLDPITKKMDWLYGQTDPEELALKIMSGM